MHFENEFIYWCEIRYKSIIEPSIFSISPFWLNHGHCLLGKWLVELFEVFWGDGLPDHFHHFLDPFSLLHLDLKIQRDSSNHGKIGDINEALRICKQSAQTAAVYLNAFRNDLINSEMISFGNLRKWKQRTWTISFKVK